MQFITTFTALAFAVVAVTVSQVTASPALVRGVSRPNLVHDNSLPPSRWQIQASIITTDEFLHWLDTTDANITYIGTLIDLAPGCCTPTQVRETPTRGPGRAISPTSSVFANCISTFEGNGLCEEPRQGLSVKADMVFAASADPAGRGFLGPPGDQRSSMWGVRVGSRVRDRSASSWNGRLTWFIVETCVIHVVEGRRPFYVYTCTGVQEDGRTIALTGERGRRSHEGAKLPP
ncbi:hypothetical protein C8T65DRAFT_765649 [Cerioporus squamosus]|nr:hypothetical protein C8T65DRAFT_765649 [Cerioporus squamosus]